MESRFMSWNPISAKRDSQSAAVYSIVCYRFLTSVADGRPRRLNRHVARKERYLSPVLSIDDRWRPVRDDLAEIPLTFNR